jgi:hypothetical protein
MPILTQVDLAELEITRDGPQGYLVQATRPFG